MSDLKLANDPPRGTPVRASERIEFIDILRGFAVLGILIANMYSYSGIAYEPQAWSGIDRIVVAVTRFLVEAKFYSLFSLLFGWGLAVQLSRAKARGVRFVPLYLRRLIILLLLGIVHGTLIWTGDILTTYALFGFLLLLFRHRSGKVLLTGVGVALLFSIMMRVPGGAMDAVREGYMNLTDFLRYNTYPHTLYTSGTYGEITRLRVQEYLGGMSHLLYFFGNVFAMFLLGLYIGKRRIFHEVQQHLGTLRKVMWAGLGVGLIFNAVHVWLLLSPDSLSDRYRPVIHVGVRTIGAPALMLFYVCGIILLFQRERWQRRLAPLGNVGRGALSNYLFQSVLCTLIFYGYGLGLYGEFGPTVGLILVAGIYWIQIRLSGWWFDRYRFGPMEWLWRTLTYRKLQLMRLGETGTERQPPRWLRGLRRVFDRVPPPIALVSAWIALLIWAGGLYAWHRHLENDSLRHQVAAVVASQPIEEENVETTGAAQDDSPAEPETQPIATPVVQPVTYEPGPIAASGDPVALAAAFDVQAALSQIQVLSGPPYLGRRAGSPQGRAAGDYIADQFAAAGLQPAGDDGTFFQSFPLEYVTLDQVPTLVIEGPDGTIYQDYELHQDFAPVLGGYAGPGTASGQVIWGNNCAHKDLDQLDVVGKVVLCRDVAMPTSGWHAAPGEGGTQSVRYPARNALEHGAVALLLLTDPQLHPPDRGSVYFESWVPEPIPVLRIFLDAAGGSGPGQDLMLGSKSSAADLSVSFTPFALNTRVHVQVSAVSGAACPETGCQGRNVLGVIPGRDPAYADQVLILGAHYDHLGQSPDGLTWTGANNDASGVAVLLEIAHSWQRIGYVPRHTVLFAAWDANELGALGAEYYVQHPRYPLENTANEIQLDMVGAGGETLYIDVQSHNSSNKDELAARIQAVAKTLAVETAEVDVEHGDHVPFQQANVSTTLLTWFVGAEDPDQGARSDQGWPYYARPGDTAERIDASKLKTASQIVGRFVLGLTESEPDILDMLNERAAAVEAGDVDAFLGTSQPDQWETDRLWFADVQSFSPTRFEMQAQNVHVAGRHADATVRMTLTYPDQGEEAEQDATQTENYYLSVRFVFHPEFVEGHGAQGWQWAGPDLTRTDPLTAGLSLAYPPGSEIGELPQWAAERYVEITALLDMPTEPDKRLTLALFPSARALRVSTALSLPSSQELWVGPDEVKLVHSSALSTSLKLDHALTALLLAQAGVTPHTAPWLWEGLPLALRAEGALAETHARYLPQLREDLAATPPTESKATAWATVDYLKQQVGWQGVGRFIVALGDACQAGLCPEPATGVSAESAAGVSAEPAEGVDTALSQVLQMDASSFESAWRNHWQEHLAAAQTGLDAVLDTRVSAVLAGERDAFLNTVDPNVPNLVQEQAYWFDQLQLETPERLTAKGEVLALLEDESLLAEVTWEYAAKEEEPQSFTMQVSFSPEQQGYRWAGAPLETLPGELVTVLYPQGQAKVAQDIWQQVTTVYPQAAATLGVQEPPSLTIKLYPGATGFRHSVLLSDPVNQQWHAWTEAGQSVKLALQKDATAKDYIPDLVEQLVRRLLVHTGVEAEWLVKGASLYLSTDLGVSESRFASRLGDVRRAASKETLYDLSDMPLDHTLAAEEAELLRTQAWDTMRYLVYAHDRAALLEVLRAQAQNKDLEQALQTTIDQTLSEFETAWATSLKRAHLSQEWVEIALDFEEEQVLPHITFLTSPALSGRQAGTPGAEMAADYVAEKFAAYGLLPAGDPVVRDRAAVTMTAALTSSLPGVTMTQASPVSMTDTQETRTFLQHFPITFTTLLDTPRLEVLDASGQVTASLDYRKDFVLAPVERTNTKVVEGELVWIGKSNYQGLNLDGKVVLCPSADELEISELVYQAKTHGARGLVVVGELENPDDFLSKTPLSFRSVSADALPVLKLTRPGYEHLLEIIGRTPPELLNAPPALPLDFHVRLEIPVSTPERVQTANVLGLLPGSDPALSQQLIILGAHYDYVGDDPARRYAGANDDASGIGVLLEIARLWQEQGYRPQRSVLFAAWGAQELGDIGSRYYVGYPFLPLAQTAAMLQLDAVGGGAGHYMEAEGLRDTEGQLLFSMEAAEDLVDGRLQLTAPRETSLLSEEKDPIYISIFEGVSSQWVRAKQSDHAPFRQIGVPTLLVTWRGASEDNWPVEIADEVEPYRLGVTGRMVTLVMMSVAR